MFLMMLLFLIVALALFDVVVFRFGTDSRNWRASGEWRWLRRHPAPNGMSNDD